MMDWKDEELIARAVERGVIKAINRIATTLSVVFVLSVAVYLVLKWGPDVLAFLLALVSHR
jgi:hypothetical protein